MADNLRLGKQVEEVYETVVGRASRTWRELALAHPDIDDVRLRRIVDQLLADGLIRSVEGVPVRYVAVPPDLALGSLVAERQRELDRMLLRVEELRRRHTEANQDHSPSMLELVPGDNGQALERLMQLHRSVQTQIRSLETPPYVAAVSPMADDEQAALDRGVVYRLVYDRAAAQAQTAESIMASIRAGEQARVINEVPIRLGLLDDRYAVLPSRPGCGITEGMIVVQPGPLFTALEALFESIWQQALPLTPEGVLDPPSEFGPAPEDEVLLALLSSGLADAAIARQLGVGLRTVQRRVSRLMSDVHAASRFQAGLAIGRRQGAEQAAGLARETD
ncbi:hypothetical protein AB0L70_09390 [Kribbella sp. NPDC051952]|uniref:hypothetical protein n=1 Tax=Kribbella sp. NPDC051952 TaxID=3154851 RepID=UPI0034499624